MGLLIIGINVAFYILDSFPCWCICLQFIQQPALLYFQAFDSAVRSDYFCMAGYLSGGGGGGGGGVGG